jgi:hypothetical protein
MLSFVRRRFSPGPGWNPCLAAAQFFGGMGQGICDIDCSEKLWISRDKRSLFASGVSTRCSARFFRGAGRGTNLELRMNSHYLARWRIVAKPAITDSKVSISIAQWESAGTVAAALRIEVQVGTVIVFASVVTVPPNAKALPVRFAKCPTVMPAASS